jgi:toxin ParE1/3/4
VDVEFTRHARADLRALYFYLADRASPTIAFHYVQRIERFCAGLAESPRRGTMRDDLRAGLRTLGFERRATIAFHITDQVVTIDRILYGGRDVTAAFED